MALNQRDNSLDALRGLAVIIMVMVDAPPDFDAIYPLLTHSPWQGITIADLAFPGFVFTMGVSAAFSLKKRRNWKIIAKIAKRTLLIFIIGLLFNITPAILSWLLVDGYDDAALSNAVHSWRLFGVLQRLALTYAAGTFIALLVKKDRLLLLTAFVLMLLSSAGFHLYNPHNPFDKFANISQAVDLLFPGEVHAYQYYGLPFDPEGLYGTLDSTATMLLGVWAGKKILRQHRSLLVLISLVLIVTGFMWSHIDIISKPLWTAPYALLTSGVNMLLLPLLGSLLSRLPFARRLLRPFLAFGCNPLFFYLLTNFGLILLWTLPSPTAGIPTYPWLWQHTVKDFGSLPFSSTLFVMMWCSLWYPLANWLYKHNIIIKL